jgi:SAM-dependent methyltransferase
MTDDSGIGAFRQATGRELEGASGEHQKRYRAYQFDLISHHCGRAVLEVGAGLGEFASQFRGLDRLVVTDVDPACVASMAQRFDTRPEVEARQLDLRSGTLDPFVPVDTVVAVNVLEHIDDDSGTLQSLSRLVRPGGNIVLWVPGYMQLYGDFDRKVGHVRRYTPQTLRAAIEGAGLVCSDVRPVNMLGGCLWWLAVKRGGVGSPNPRLVGLYDRFVVPVTKVAEARLTPPFGQSVLAVAALP